MIVVVGEAWGAEEEKEKTAFVGPSGKLLRAHLADLKDVIFTNLVNQRPPKNDFEFFRQNQEILEKGLAELEDLIRRTEPKLVIGLGSEPLRYLTNANPPSIMLWRGSQLWLEKFPGIPFLPTVHPAAVLRNYEWSFLLKKDIERAKRFLSGEIGWEAPTYQFAKDDPAFLDQIDPSMPIAVDIETRDHTLTHVGIAISVTSACSFTFPAKPWIFTRVNEVLRKARRIIGHNYLYDATYVRRVFGIEKAPWFDTMIGHHLLYPGLPKDLGFLASLYCRHYVQWKNDKGNLALYNCEDAARTWEICWKIRSELEKEGLLELYKERRESWKLAAEMTWRGIRFDEQKREAFLAETKEILARKEAILREIWPKKDAWWRSSKEVREIFYEVMGLKPVLHRKTGKPTVSKAAFQDLRQRAPTWLEPTVDFILGLIEEVRSLQVFIASFLEKTTDVDGRMRCFFDISGTETFRLSSSRHPFGSGGNLQNIPTGNEE